MIWITCQAISKLVRDLCAKLAHGHLTLWCAGSEADLQIGGILQPNRWLAKSRGVALFLWHLCNIAPRPRLDCGLPT